MKNLEYHWLILAAMSPIGIYAIYFIATTIPGKPHAVSVILFVIFVSMIVQGCWALLEITGLFIRSESHLFILPSSVICQLLSWPAFCFHQTYLMALPYALRIGNLGQQLPGPSYASGYLYYYYLFVGTTSLATAIGYSWFLLRGRSPYLKKCCSIIVFLGTFSIILVVDLSKAKTIPLEMLSLYWALPTITTLGYLKPEKE